MGYLEDGVELGVVGAVSAVALRATPVGLWGMGTAALVGGAVSFGRAYWWDDKDFNEALNTGLVTAGTTFVGGAVMGKVVPWFGKAATGGTKTLGDVASATANLNKAKNGFSAAQKNLKDAKTLGLSKEAIEDRASDLATARKQLGDALADLKTAQGAPTNPPSNKFLASVTNSVAGVPPKLPYWAGGMVGAGGGIFLRPERGYTGAVPTYIAATPKDGSFNPGMRPLKVPDKRKIDEWIAEGKVPPEWAVPPMLAAYMAGKPVA